MICLKVIVGTNYQVNLCDKGLIGSKINGVSVSNHFYGFERPVKEVIKELGKATVINALGVESVKLVESVKGELSKVFVNGIPHVQFYVINP